MNSQTDMTNLEEHPEAPEVSAAKEAVSEQSVVDAAAEAGTKEAGVPSSTVTKKKKEPVVFFGLAMPEPIANGVRSFRDFGARWRKQAIEKTPRVIVNHSTNLIGSMQLVAEVLMFKSSGLNLVDKENRGKPLHYITDPLKNIYGGVFKKSKIEFKGNPLKASFYKELPTNIRESFASLKDLEKATARDLTHTAPMYNKWSARSGFAGICAMTIATLLPDKKDKPEETEAMTKMAKEHTASYVGKRLYQALNPLEWFQHKRQFSGLGMMAAGGLSVVSGFRQVEGKFTDEMIKAGMKNTQKYMRNNWQIAGGLITTLGGAQLMLAIDNDSGWRNFGLTQMMRLMTLPNSIAARFNKTEQGAEWYLASQAVFQTKNFVAASIGGAEKGPDGKVVDHAGIRKEASSKVKAASAKNKLEKAKAGTEIRKEELELPATTVEQADVVERAMPERHEAHLAQKEQHAAVAAG